MRIVYPPELPVSARAETIRAALRANQVLIVAGATGSGKTTQLPKLALEVEAERRAARTPEAVERGESGGTTAPLAGVGSPAGARPDSDHDANRQARNSANDALPGEDGPTPSPAADAGRRRRRRRRRRPTEPRKPELVGITQPRRIAATSVAARVAEELGCELGQEVGYQIRFEDRTSAATQLKFMTDGILLAEIQSDPLLLRYHTIIIDEAHERGLTVDFLLGWLKQLLPKRPDLRVIVSSATIETSRFTDFFDDAPIIQVEGRTFPVDVLYEPPDPELDLADAVADAVQNLAELDPDGDFLVFLPGEREILDAERVLLGRKLRHTEVLPLYARLSAADQNRVFSPRTSRRVILCTNVAETSLTIPGIVYVVDAGLARLARYDARTGITRLLIEPISRASADQRKGRAGRIREGLCVRLYEEADFDSRAGFTDPEIRRVGLAGVILRMKALELGDVETFPFLDAPSPRSIVEGYRVLGELGALDDDRQLTPLGRQLARFPVDPRVGRIILAGAEYGVLEEVLVLAAGLEVQDPRERPRGKEQHADQSHRRFRDAESDFASLLSLWAFISEAQKRGTSHLRRVCKDGFISFRRVREWREVHRQLSNAVKELRLDRSLAASHRRHGARADTAGLDRHARIHVALLSGLLSRIGMYVPEARNYLGARQTRFVIHPSSALAKKPPAWVVAFELVETTNLFARNVARLQPEWLEKAGPHLLKKSYSEPHWSERHARASVREHATLFGLPVRRDHSVEYAKLEPGRARLIFLEHALVRGEYKSPGAFQSANQALLRDVARLRDKARKSDMLSDEEALLTFFDQRVPRHVVDGKSFEKWRTEAEQSAPRLLYLRMQDVLLEDEGLDPADYPDELDLDGATLPLTYLFEPASENDGITVSIPLALVPRLDAGIFDWTIPAWCEVKLFELLERLPRALRREVGDRRELARSLATILTPFEEPLIPAMTRQIAELCGVNIVEGALRPDLLPGYLRLTCRITGHGGKVLGESRDIPSLFEAHGASARSALAAAKPSPALRRQNITAWDFGELPKSVVQQVAGSRVELFPALLDRQSSVELTLCQTLATAVDTSRTGVWRLLQLTHPRAVSDLSKRVPASLSPLCPTLSPLGPTRAQNEALRGALVELALRESCPLDANTLPRTEPDFNALATRVLPKLDAALSDVIEVVSRVSRELTETRQAIATAARQPGAAAARRDIDEHLAALLPPNVLAAVPLPRLAHFPRYLRALRTRLTNALVNPQKDASKLEPFTPLWHAYQKARAGRQSPELEELRWAFEELRVSIFAPQLKTAFPVSLAKVEAALALLAKP